MRNAHLVIGEITKPQGVRGELKLRPITCNLERFEDLKVAYLKRGDDFEEIHVHVTRIGADAVFFFMEGIDDRNAAERLRGELVYVDRAHAVQLDENSAFICDLIGLNGVTDDGSQPRHALRRASARRERRLCVPRIDGRGACSGAQERGRARRS